VVHQEQIGVGVVPKDGEHVDDRRQEAAVLVHDSIVEQLLDREDVVAVEHAVGGEQRRSRGGGGGSVGRGGVVVGVDTAPSGDE
jgi:hypothetical protein